MLSKVWSYQLSKGQCVYLNQQAPHGKHQNGQDNMNANQEVLWEECGTHELQQDMHQEKRPPYILHLHSRKHTETPKSQHQLNFNFV